MSKDIYKTINGHNNINCDKIPKTSDLIHRTRYNCIQNSAQISNLIHWARYKTSNLIHRARYKIITAVSQILPETYISRIGPIVRCESSYFQKHRISLSQ